MSRGRAHRAGTLRVIAGRLKGRRLATPTWDGLRPTSDRLRETLFNVLAPRIEGARLLDGFAGTGAVGIEALSRGASSVTFVEADHRAIALIADNLRECGILDGYTVAARAWASVPAAPGRAGFDIVFLDPPYESPDLDASLAVGGALAAATGLVVLEHARRWTPPATFDRWTRVRELRSGDSTLSFYEWAGAQMTPAEESEA